MSVLATAPAAGDARSFEEGTLRAHQQASLRWTLMSAHRTELYRARLTAALGFEPGADAHAYAHVDVDDLSWLPVTTKDDLRALPSPVAGLAIPLHDVRQWHTSSGTTGRRTAVAHSAQDLVRWAAITARALTSSGVGRGTRVHNAYGYGLFTGGLGFHLGLARLEACVLPASHAPDLHEHLDLMDEHRAEVLLATPSLALALVERCEAQGRGPPPTLRACVIGGEPWGAGARARIEAGLGVRAFDTYGLSEVIGPGVAHECLAGGLHVYVDHFLPEIVAEELVLTTLTRQASPRLRYRTGDRARLQHQRCLCGDAAPRLEGLEGRVADFLQIGSAEITPVRVQEALLSLPALAHVFRCCAGPDGAQLVVEVEPRSEHVDALQVGAQARLALERALDVEAKVTVLPLGTLPRAKGKADHRLRPAASAWP